jgi:hypothetical protein
MDHVRHPGARRHSLALPNCQQGLLPTDRGHEGAQGVADKILGILTCKVRHSRTMACMHKIEKPSPTESPLFFEFDPKPAEEMLTAWGGLPLVVQAFRSLGLPGSVKQHVAVKERQRGYDEATFVESFVVLNAAGGECLDDFERLRADRGLGELLGHEVPSPEAARKFLYAFHEEEMIQQAKQQRLPDQMAYIPSESEPLEGLGKVNQDLIRRFGERCPQQKIATVDQDTTGGDGRGTGRRVSGWQCAGADGSLDRGESSVCRAAQNGDKLLLSRGFGLS